MAHRQIMDDAQCLWDVWEVNPASVARKVTEERRSQPGARTPRKAMRIVVADELREGWLTFQCETERRRITPIPLGWEAMTDDELLGLLARATPVARARSVN
jgi:hypothetical protein